MTGARILICDPIAQEGIDLLAGYGEVDVRLGLSPQELCSVVGEYDALVVRSETQVTADVVEAGTRLQVIGRAGVGVDNIDLQAATRRGIVVVNAPTGNTISAAEHTVGLMLALARHIPQADASLKQGQWNRREYIGVELRGKTLGVLGLGQVGSEVARRGRGLEMRVIAHDPFVPEERARVLGVELVSFEELLRQSDFLTVHTTLTQGTRGLIGKKELGRMKATARVINTARGGIVDEKALYEAVESGRIAGAAVDVFSKEPATDNVLIRSSRIITTPHLGASTTEAQERVAVDVAQQILAVLRGEPAPYAVNAPLVPPETLAVVAPYLDAAELTGLLATQLAEGQMREIRLRYSGEIALHDTTVLKAAAIRGLLRPISEENVTVVNAEMVAAGRGLRIIEIKGPSEDTYSNLVTAEVETSAGVTSVSGTVEHGRPHVVDINGLRVDLTPSEQYLLICDNQDRPGMIGAVGMLMSKHDINISSMKVGRREPRGRAVMVLGLDEPVTDEQIQELLAIPDIFSAKLVRLDFQ